MSLTDKLSIVRVLSFVCKYYKFDSLIYQDNNKHSCGSGKVGLIHEHDHATFLAAHCLPGKGKVVTLLAIESESG